MNGVKLPELPAGMFWRFRYDGLGLYMLEIRERRRLGSRVVVSVPVVPAPDVTAQAQISDAADDAYADLRYHHAEHLRHAELHALCGSYGLGEEDVW